MNSRVAKTIATEKAAIENANVCISRAQRLNNETSSTKFKKFLTLLTKSLLSSPLFLAYLRTNFTSTYFVRNAKNVTAMVNISLFSKRCFTNSI